MNRHDRRDDWTLVIAVALIAFGGVMLFKQVAGEWWPIAEALRWTEKLVWPIVLIFIGLMLYMSSKRRPLPGGQGARKLYRSRSDRMVAGVLGGLGDYVGIDPVWLRVAFAIIVLMGFGPAIILYIVGAVVIPEEPVGSAAPVDWSSAKSAPSPTPPPASGWPHNTGGSDSASGETPPPPPPPVASE